MSLLYTTLGPKSASELGLILPHEHIFVDLRTPDVSHHGQASPLPGGVGASQADVLRVMVPELERARAAGITALVECTPEGVGRRVDLVQAVSQAANFPVVVATGIYREPWVPDWARASSEDDLSDWMRRELADGIAGTGTPLPGKGTRAGFIKVSAGDDGLTPTEAKILRAAGRAALAEGAAIGSHTIRGRVARDQLDVLDGVGFPAQRFIWIHAHVETDFSLNLELARRGAWIEYDGIGWEDNDDLFAGRVQRMLDAGLGNRVMLSMDRGWYDPAQPGGGKPKPFTYISEVFLPKLRSAGVDESTIRQLTVDNPFHAFAR